jgi:hypothetical protein
MLNYLHQQQQENEMAFEQKPNTGALFKNDDRTEENQQPHYRGSFNVDGREFWLSAWLQTSQGGKRYMALALKPNNAAQPKNGTAKSAGGGSPPFDDAVPF